MNDIYTNTNPTEHLHYDPLLLHQENEKNGKSKQHENEGQHSEHNKDHKTDKSSSQNNNKTNIIIKDTKDTSKKNDKQGDHAELPEHWEQRRTPEGLIYYANHQTKSTQWHHPYYNNLYTSSNTLNTVTNDTISTRDESTTKHKGKTTHHHTSAATDKDKEKKKEGEQTHHKRRKNRSNSAVEMDGFIRVLRTPPKHVKVGYSSILFSSHPSLSLQITATAQSACDWLNSQRKMNFRIDNITINLNRSLVKGLHLWMTVYRDNSTRRSYDRSRQWKSKVFGLSSIAMTLDPHLHGNSKTSKIMTDFLTWRSSLPPQVDVIYTLSYSRTYSCVLAFYLSLNPREDPTNRMTSSDQVGEREGDISYHKPRHHHHHKDGDHSKSTHHHHKDGDHSSHHHHKDGDHTSHHHHHHQQHGDHPHHHHHDDKNHPHHHHHDDRDHPHHHHHDDHPHHHHHGDVSKEHKISHSENKNKGVSIDPKHAVGLSEGDALHHHHQQQHHHHHPDQREISDHEKNKDVKNKDDHKDKDKGVEGLGMNEELIKKEEEKNRILNDPNSNPPLHAIPVAENLPKPSLDHTQNKGEVLNKDVKGDIKLDNKDGGVLNNNNNNSNINNINAKNDDFNVHNNPPAEFT